MVGRRRRRRRPSAAAQRQRFPTAYFEVHQDLNIASLANGGDAVAAVVDNSLDFSPANSVVNFRKLTLRWYEDMASGLGIAWAITRELQDVAAPTLDISGTVRDLRNENHLLRGPIFTVTRERGDSPIMRKTMVLKNITLDENDDLRLCVTNMGGGAFSAGTNQFHMLTTGFYRIVT